MLELHNPSRGHRSAFGSYAVQAALEPKGLTRGYALSTNISDQWSLVGLAFATGSWTRYGGASAARLGALQTIF